MAIGDCAPVRARQHAGQTPPPALTSASYDLGRLRALQEAEAKADLLASLAREEAERCQRVRDLLKDRPDLLAEYETRMAAIDRGAR